MHREELFGQSHVSLAVSDLVKVTTLSVLLPNHACQNTHKKNTATLTIHNFARFRLDHESARRPHTGS